MCSITGGTAATASSTMFTCLWNFLDWLDQPVTNSTSSMDSKKIVQMSGPITTTSAQQQQQQQIPQQQQQTVQQPAARNKESGTPSISGVRRRSGPTQGLRSPAAKRPVSAPVALQGWLHKQGSEGLMLWKKRWFVLSEYCLFYYKGPEEEKLLGSILLPSYRITVCRPEDKINKKFAFKAEHANMRTYHFAADTREGMNQWVNALTLASLLQDPNPGGGEIVLAGEGENGERSARPSVSSISSTMNQSADDSDSGFHGFQSRDEPSNNNSSPNSVNTGSFPGSSGNSNNNNNNNNDAQPQPMVNGWMQHQQQQQPQQQQPFNPQQQPVFYPQRPRNYGQPVYANAPPKPRRMSENPSPSPDGRLSSKSPLSMEYVDARTPNPVYGVQRLTPAQQQNLRTDKSGLNYGFVQPSERRTPDTYGRSSAKPNGRRQVNGADYEDVYSAPPPQLYQRPAGPVGYTKGPAPTPIAVPVYAQQQQQQQQQPTSPAVAAAQVHPQYYVVTGPVTNAVTVMRQQQQPRSQQPPRPHSADFLEYEATRSPQTPTQPGNIPNQTRCPQRPKSSLDIVNPSDVAVGDNYFYSEERYAAQMRQSAVYFHQAPPHLQQTQPPPPPPPQQQQQQQQLQQQQQQARNPSLSRATTPSKSSVSRDTESGIGTLSEMSCTSVRRSQREHPHQPHSLQRHTERTTASEAAHMRRSLRESRNPALIHGGGGDQSPGRSLSREYQRRWPEQQQQQQQQFARSASARLPRNRPIIDYDDDDEDDDDYAEKSSGQDSRDGERKIQQREESMKRLLEWKQRMLQSPLTRKPTAAASSSSSSQRTSQQQHNAELANCYKQQALLELAAHEAALAEQAHRHRRREDTHHRPHHPRSKSTDARRTSNNSVAALPRYNSYSSDDEELSDVRRKRTRRPTGRSPRSFEKEPPSPSTTLPPAGILKQQQQRNDFEAHGYEEMGFPRPASKMEVKPIQVQPKITPPKKPSGILKTPGVYATSHPSTRNEAGRLSTLAGYMPGETWPVQKNVQWDSVKDDDEKEEWEEKIDESKVIKEFSYQYIKQEDVKEEPTTNDQVNLVQSRIRSFESSNSSPEKEPTIMQEPLKVSPPHLAPEAYVSRIADSPRKATATVIREFALGDPKNKINEETKEESEEELAKPSADRNKSVKDLLADFERKSQQVHQQEQEKQQQSKPVQRAVFSDTETLLYETGSDRDEDTRIVPKYKEQDKSENNIEKSIEDSVNPAFARLSVTESLVTHGDRLSGDSDNASPTRTEDPNLEEHYLPMTPRKSILDPSADDRPMPKMMESLFAGLREESSYVEMTQNGMTRSLLAPGNSDYSTLENQHYEFVCVSDNKMEPVYMEVSQLADKEENSQALMKSAAASNKEATGETPLLNSRGDLPDILTALKSDSSDADDESSKDLDSIDAPRHPRFSLSDTFRPASYYLGASQTLIAELHDSSDSELVSPPPIPTSPPPLDDLDSLEMHDSLEIKKPSSQSRDSPKTWNKPAAQVEVRRSPLGFHDSRMSLDSSDSVELRSHDDEAARQLKRRPVSDDMCEVLDSLDELESLGSRFDGASIDLDQYLEELQARDAFNVEMYAKDLSYNSIYGLNENMLNVADKLQKSPYSEMNKATGMVVNETTSSRTSLDQPYRYGPKSKTSSASSLPSMRVSEVPPTTNHQHSQSFTGDTHYENISRFSPAIVTARSDTEVAHHYHEHGRRTPKSVPSPLANTVATHSRDSSYSFVSGTASVANYSAQRPASAQSSPVVATVQSTSTYIEQRTQQPQYHSRSASQDSARYSLSPNHRSSSSQDSSQYPASTSAVVRGNPQSDQSGAPYYYSDLPAASTIPIDARPEHHHHHQRPIIAHTSRLPQLNNQRGDTAALNKRNDIGRMVNPIARQMPRQIQVDDIDEARKIAAELRKTTCQLLAEDKAGLVDRRNFYEADTLRRVKSTEPFVEPAPITPNDLAARNLYPHGLRDKSGSQTQLQLDNASGSEFTSTAATSHRRSRSLEGLLDDAGLQNLVEQRNRANRQQAVVTAQQAQPQQEPPPVVNPEPAANDTNNSNNAFGGEDPWEQDSLWRESLRRVSLRHARSLDNLDSPSSSSRNTPTTESSRTRTKITRGVTYVNDSVANSVERPRVKRRSDESTTATMSNGTIAENNSNETSAMQDNEDDAYESLAMDRIGAGGYIWDPENEAYRKPEHFLAEGNPAPAVAAVAASTTSTSGNSFELDREKLRQWDLLSSACLLQEQPGRGLPATSAAAPHPAVASLATASSAAATGCASAVDASHRAKTMTTTQQQQQHQQQLEPKSAAAAAQLTRTSNGPGEWLYHRATTGAGLAYRK